MTRQITEFLLYRWRYILGYILAGVVLAILLALAGFYSPGGLTTAEMDASVKASLVSYDHFDPAMVVNLPFSLLQKASFAIFGVKMLSIKLPSLILGFLSIVALLPLLIMWFKRNVALVTIGLVATTGQFLFVSQSGTPSILYIFYALWILLAATMVSRNAKFLVLWKILLFVLAALSLYTPLSAYMLIAMLLAATLHPHMRYIIRRLSPTKVAIATTLGVIIVAPLAYALIRNPATGLTLMGIPTSWPPIIDNFVLLFKQSFDFTSPHTGAIMTPVYGMVSVAII